MKKALGNLSSKELDLKVLSLLGKSLNFVAQLSTSQQHIGLMGPLAESLEHHTEHLLLVIQKLRFNHI
jgi:hypothetical protein